MEKAIYKIYYLEWRNMKLFGNRKKTYDDDGYYDNHLKNFEDFVYDNTEQKKRKSNPGYSANIFDLEEEAKLDAQLNSHLSDIQLKEQYEKGIKANLEVIVSETDLRTTELNYLNILLPTTNRSFLN